MKNVTFYQGYYFLKMTVQIEAQFNLLQAFNNKTEIEDITKMGFFKSIAFKF